MGRIIAFTLGLAALAIACDQPAVSPLTDPPSAMVTPAPPGLLVFSSGRDDPYEEIYTMRTDGTGLTRLTFEENVWDSEARFSPDGRRIVFASGRNDPAGLSRDLFLMDADGSNVVQLTSGPGDDSSPHWSPDGKTIAFGRDDPATAPFNGDIFTINADGSNETRLTSDPLHEGIPVWSPNGKRIGFFRGRNTFAMDVDGTNVVQLTSDPQPELLTDWSANGKILLNRRTGPGNWDVFVMNDDGSDIRPVMTDPGNDLYAVFSANAQWIAVNTERNSTALYPHIWIMRLDGSDAVQVTTSNAWELFPDWRPGY